VTATLARRLVKVEATARARLQVRFDAAVARLRATMDPEHARLAADWLQQHVANTRLGPCTGGADPRHVCPRCLERFHPPALARAVWFQLLAHVASGVPVALPPDVAEIYLGDPDAYPANACEGCGYLMPMRTRLRADGTYRHIASYLGACPVCGRDNHPEEEGAP
jgi:hypothetical protein